MSFLPVFSTNKMVFAFCACLAGAARSFRDTSSSEGEGHRFWLPSPSKATSSQLCSTVGMTTTATPQTRRHELPDGHQDDRADQRSQKRDAVHSHIPDPIDDNHLREQPGANQRGNDGPNEAKGETPANDGLGNQANNRCNDQVNEKVGAEAPDIVTQLDGDPIGQKK